MSVWDWLQDKSKTYLWFRDRKDFHRPGWDEYGLIVAHAIATRADCTRRQVGAVIFDKDHRIVSTGYNGSPPGGPSCLAGLCPRGKHFRLPDSVGVETGQLELTLFDVCGGCGSPWPCAEAVAPRSSYDTGPGQCIALHAEQNAIVFADPTRLKGSTMYVTDRPCDGCSRLISGVQISRVIHPEMVEAFGSYEDLPPEGYSAQQWLAEGQP